MFKKCILVFVFAMLFNSVVYAEDLRRMPNTNIGDKFEDSELKEYDSQTYSEDMNQSSKTQKGSEEIGMLTESTNESFEDYRYIYIDEECIVAGREVSQTLPDGVTFDVQTNTLTLNNASIPGMCINQFGDFDGQLIINLIGNNYITANFLYSLFSIDAGYNTELIITGTGTLNMNGGIWTRYFTMNSGNLNIITEKNNSNLYFYGISTITPANEYTAEKEAIPRYNFNGGNITITDAGHSNREISAGIDAQHGNISIKNTIINMSLNGKTCFGLASGWTSSWGKQYGGMLTIQNSTIDCKVTSGWSAYFYKFYATDDSEYYVGKNSLSKVTPSKAFTYYEYLKRIDCKEPLLMIKGGTGQLIEPLLTIKDDTEEPIDPESFIKITYHPNGGVIKKKEDIITSNGRYASLPKATRKKYLFKGWYTASIGGKKVVNGTEITNPNNHSLYARWEKVSVGMAKISKLKNVKGKKVKLSIKKVSGAKGYLVYYASNKKFNQYNAVSTTKATATLKKLSKGKRYYIKIRAYKVDSTGTKIYGKWSSIKFIVIEK